MGLLTNYTGIGMSPRPTWQHQSILARLLLHSYDELNAQGLVMLPEATISSNANDKAPDIVVFDEFANPLIIIEIITHNKLRRDMRKCENLCVRFPNAEYFVYDYEAQQLYQFDYQSRCWVSDDELELQSAYLSKPMMCYFNIEMR